MDKGISYKDIEPIIKAILSRTQPERTILKLHTIAKDTNKKRKWYHSIIN